MIKAEPAQPAVAQPMLHRSKNVSRTQHHAIVNGVHETVIGPPQSRHNRQLAWWGSIQDALMHKAIAKRLKQVTVEEFKQLMAAKLIRPASLSDVYGDQHKRPLYEHPNTKQYWIAIPRSPSGTRQ